MNPRTNRSQARASEVAGNGYRQTAMAAAWAIALCVPVLGGGGAIVYRGWSARHEALQVEIRAAFAYERVVAAPAGAMLDIKRAAHGRDVFASVCVMCHGASGTGVTGLGKNLVESDFLAANDDGLMHQFLIEGRPDAKPAAMPARGGRPDLTDADLADVVVYLRGLQDPRRLPELPPPVALATAPVSADEKAQALAAAGGDAELAEYIAHGSKIFNTTCIACHGAGGVGIKGNGKPLANNEFVRSLDDDSLLAFIKKGRDPSDPKNTTGVGMPARGGNPALSDDDLLDVIDYLRTLQPKTMGTASAAQ